MWDETLELEAVLRRPYNIARSVELKSTVTGAQAMQMIRQWQSLLHSSLDLLAFPKSAKLKHRKREFLEKRPRSKCHQGTQQFSMAKGISDCNMKSLFLRLLTKIKANKKRYKPSSKRVWDRYCQKFRGCRNNFSSASGESDESGSSSSDSE
jgi:hypothetical protein